jgi:hypothetical protein
MDSKGILWIMFGRRNFYDTFLHAVWNYNPKTDQYRYVWKSELEDPRNPGELGVPAETNYPGGNYFGAATIDNNDNIWFTVSNTKYNGEFWMFNTTSWMFVRVQGLDGTDTEEASIGANPGQPGEDVWPGYIEGACMVTDSLNNLWLAGYGDDVTNLVWHFNTTSKLWTYVHGNVVTISDPHNSTFFGGSWSAGCDIDENDRVWLYGGWAIKDPNNYDDYGSIWTFDTRVKREWEFEYGADTYQITSQVASDDYHPDNHPAAAESSLFIDRHDGTMMLAAGGGFGNQKYIYGALDTVWLYSKSLKQWKLVYGNISVVDSGAEYTNYRQPGSKFPGTVNPGKHNGKNFNGDIFIVGGGSYEQSSGLWRKDLWIIPQDQCTLGIDQCDSNADCVEELAGYSCECKEGYTGDGFTCTAPVPPVSEEPTTTPTATVPTSAPVAAPQASGASSFVLASAVVACAIVALML